MTHDENTEHLALAMLADLAEQRRIEQDGTQKDEAKWRFRTFLGQEHEIDPERTISH